MKMNMDGCMCVCSMCICILMQQCTHCSGYEPSHGEAELRGRNRSAAPRECRDEGGIEPGPLQAVEANAPERDAAAHKRRVIRAE